MSGDLQAAWDALAAQVLVRNLGVDRGKMMSADALTWCGKVFAFYSIKGGQEGMGCRLGREFDIERLGLKDWQNFAPFKTRPPMKDWIVVGQGELQHWPDVIQTALKIAQNRNS